MRSNFKIKIIDLKTNLFTVFGLHYLCLMKCFIFHRFHFDISQRMSLLLSNLIGMSQKYYK